VGVKVDLTLKEEHILRVVENYVLRKFFAPGQQKEGSAGKITQCSFPLSYISYSIKTDQVSEAVRLLTGVGRHPVRMSVWLPKS
jgi:hypothetical protein